MILFNKNSYKDKNSFEQRSKDTLYILQKFPDRKPVIIEKYYNSILTDIDKNKYLIPIDMTVGQLIYVIRKRIKLEPHKAIFIFINNITPCITSTIQELYDKYKEEDNFLYIVYQEESVFGI